MASSIRADRLLVLACEVAIKAPLRRNHFSFEARIPWWIVEEIRDVLEDRGVDWRTALAKDKTRRAEAKAERRAELYPPERSEP
jgi:hypothetical protein